MSAKCQRINRPCECHETEPSESLTVWAARLADSLDQSVRDFIVASDENLGDIELQVNDRAGSFNVKRRKRRRKPRRM